MKKRHPFQLLPRDVLLIITKKLADKDVGALRCDRWLDERLSTPFHRRISESLKVKAVAAGDGHSLVLMRSGQLLACGNNEQGQLGLGDKEDRKHWTPIGELNDSIIQIAAGGNHTLVLTQRGQLFTCGANTVGQLGLGNTQHRDTLTTVEGLTEPVGWVSGGYAHTVAFTQVSQ